MRRSLRLFIGDGELDHAPLETTEVSMELDEFTQILQDAIIWDRSWLKDLSDERVKISADLYEVLMAYAAMKPSA